MLPVCVKCGREMRCVLNDALVYHPMESMDGELSEIDFVVLGDRFRCPSCKTEVVTGFGKLMMAGQREQDELKSMINHTDSPIKILRN